MSQIRKTAAIASCAALLFGAACSKRQSAAERERALMKTIIGSENGGRPIMGQFALKKEDAGKVTAAMRTSSRTAFDLASKLAVKKWVYEDRWCDDAVRQIVFLGGEKEALATTADDLQSRLKEKILERHELMYKERPVADCERALRRMHEAKSFAVKQNLEHMHFGY
jgi:hypothetical protein